MLNDAANGRQIWLLKTLQDPWFHFQYPPTKMNLPMPFKTIPCGIGPVHFHVCFRKVIRFDFQVVCMERSLIAAHFGGPSTREVSSRLQAGTRLRVVGFGECVDRLDAGGGGLWRSKTPRIAIHKTHAGPRFVSTRVTPASTNKAFIEPGGCKPRACISLDGWMISSLCTARPTQKITLFAHSCPLFGAALACVFSVIWVQPFQSC